MAQTALLVSEQRVKQWTNLDDNVRVNEVTPFIIQAQDIYLQDRLGTKFFTRLKAGVIANDLNADEQLLLNDYVGPMLAHYSLYLMMPGLKYKLVEKGVLNGTSEETTPTTLEELRFLRQATLDTAEFYDQRLKEYLCDVESGTFPEYSDPGSDGMHPNHETAYFSGLVTDTWRYEKCNCKSNCECIGGEYIN